MTRLDERRHPNPAKGTSRQLGLEWVATRRRAVAASRMRWVTGHRTRRHRLSRVRTDGMRAVALRPRRQAASRPRPGTAGACALSCSGAVQRAPCRRPGGALWRLAHRTGGRIAHHASGALGYHCRWQRQLTSGDARHDRRVRHTQAADALDPKLLVDDGADAAAAGEPIGRMESLPYVLLERRAVGRVGSRVDFCPTHLM